MQKIGVEFEGSEDVRAAMVEGAAARAGTLPNVVASIRDRLTECDPSSALAIVALYGGNISPQNRKLEYGSYLTDIKQNHIELLQAITLTIPKEKWGQGVPTPEKIQVIIDSLKELGGIFLASRIAVSDTSSNEESVLALIQERIRLHTQAVRNWGYFKEVLETLGKLYSEHDII
ncbi:hypothetical protein KCG44_14230, partial [Pacificimonas sp. WHA3]